MEAVLAAGMLMWSSLRATAHTLPISYIFVVTDNDYVHLELSFNPFELANFTDVDTNRNGRLEPEELNSTAERITRQILDHLMLAADGKPVAAESAGITPDTDSHHATMRAHFRVDTRHAKISLKSNLQAITSPSHLSQVNFLRDGGPQLAQLDSQTHVVTFADRTGEVDDPAPRPSRPTGARTSVGITITALGTALTLVFLVLQRTSKPHPTGTNPHPVSPLTPPPQL